MSLEQDLNNLRFGKLKIDIRSKIQTQHKMLRIFEKLPPRPNKTNQNQQLLKLTPGQNPISGPSFYEVKQKKADCNDYFSTRTSMQYIFK